MFTYRHFIWLFICAVLIAGAVYAYGKKKPPLTSVLSVSCGICVLSELIKVFSVIEMVPSTDGSLVTPYLPLNHLPLHFCSIMVLIIFYARFVGNESRRESVLAFMCPTGVLGAAMAFAMPSIFSTTIPVEKAFTSPMAYQFFIYHAMLFALGLIIMRSGEIPWQKKHLVQTLTAVAVMAAVSIYVNSIMAAPHYVDGKLISVDFRTNFFFTTLNPLGIAITEKWQWMLYLLIITAAAGSLITAFFCIFLFPAAKKARARLDG